MKRQSPTTARGRILTCKPATRRIEAGIRDGGVVQVAVIDTGPLFRWPKEGELWTLERKSNTWFLGSLIEQGPQNQPIEDLQPGDTKLYGTTIRTEDGRTLATTDQLGSATIESLETAPANPIIGQIYFNTADAVLYIYTLSGWTNVSGSSETHNHPQSDIIGLIGALSAKQDASTAATDAELSAGLATKANTLHSHTLADIIDAESITVPEPERVRVYKDTDTTLSNDTATNLSFNQELYDSHDLHSAGSSQIVVPIGAGGLWTAGASIEFQTNSTGSRAVWINRYNSNDTLLEALAYTRVPAATGKVTHVSIEGELELNAGDYLLCLVSQNSGGNLNVSAGNTLGGYKQSFWASRNQGSSGSISAYEVAVAEGFIGDEAAWLASLVGPQGPAGDIGPQGPQGPPGVDGADGSGAGDLSNYARFDNSNIFTEPQRIQGPTGYTGLSLSMDGLELVGNGMNTSQKHTPALKFMSTDPELTTENPKFLAAITGTARETYSDDTKGAMGLDFFTTPLLPGASSLPQLAMTLDYNKNLILKGDLFAGPGKQIFGEIGSAAAPGISFNGDSNTGFYQTGVNSNDIVVSTGGSPAATFGLSSTTFQNQVLADIGTAAAPGISFKSDSNTGFYQTGSNANAISVSTATSRIALFDISSVTLYGTLSMNSNKVSNVADATNTTDAVNLRTGDSRYTRVVNEAHINVRDYGALGNGSADDKPAFNAALAAGEGGTIICPPGNYRISSTLNIPNKTTLMGVGRTPTGGTQIGPHSSWGTGGYLIYLAFNATVSAANSTPDPYPSETRVENMILQCGTGSYYASSGIRGDGLNEGAGVRGVRIANVRTYGIHMRTVGSPFQSAQQWSIEEVTIQGKPSVTKSAGSAGVYLDNTLAPSNSAEFTSGFKIADVTVYGYGTTTVGTYQPDWFEAGIKMRGMTAAVLGAHVEYVDNGIDIGSSNYPQGAGPPFVENVTAVYTNNILRIRPGVIPVISAHSIFSYGTCNNLVKDETSGGITLPQGSAGAGRMLSGYVRGRTYVNGVLQ